MVRRSDCKLSLIGRFQDDVLETMKEAQLSLQQLRPNHDVLMHRCCLSLCCKHSAGDGNHYLCFQPRLLSLWVQVKLIDNQPIGIMSG